MIAGVHHMGEAFGRSIKWVFEEKIPGLFKGTANYFRDSSLAQDWSQPLTVHCTPLPEEYANGGDWDLTDCVEGEPSIAGCCCPMEYSGYHFEPLVRPASFDDLPSCTFRASMVQATASLPPPKNAGLHCPVR